MSKISILVRIRGTKKHNPTPTPQLKVLGDFEGFWHLPLCEKQGPASNRYSTRTQIFLTYSNSSRTKHYSDCVVSSMNTRYFWTIAHSMTLVLSVKYWEESFICSISSTILYSNFSFLSVLMYKTWGKFELFFTNRTNLHIMTVISLMGWHPKLHC